MAGVLPTYDYEAEQAALARQQQLLDAMQGQSLQPMGGTQMLGNVAIQHSPMEGIAKIAQAYAAKYGQAKLDAKRTELGQRYAGDLRSGVDRLIEGLSAAPGQIPAVNDESGGHSGDPLSAESASTAKRNAILSAVASNHPVLRQLGGQYLSTLTKDQLSQKDILGLAAHYDPGSVLQFLNSGGRTPLQPKKDYKVVDNQLVEVGGPTPTVAGDFRTTYGPVAQVATGPNGPVLGQIATATGEVKFAPAAANVKVDTKIQPTVLNKGAQAGAENFWKDVSKQVGAYAEAARAASEQRQAIAELQRLESQGVFSNNTAGAQTFMTNLAQGLGMPLSSEQQAKLGTSEGFNSVATQLWQNVISKSGGNRGVTKEEAIELKNITPQLSNSPQARMRMYAILNRAAERAIAQHANAHKNYVTALQADRMDQVDPSLFNASMPEPQAPNPVTPVGKAPSVSNWPGR